ncbi:PSD1 domain-containing protein [bacterium]|nr:PSD1 domain-containing protein [bacterium]
MTRTRRLAPLLWFPAVVLAYRLAGVTPRLPPPPPADTRPAVTVPPTAPPGRIDFARHVRPILSAHCFRCHGPADDTREGDLRLDRPDGVRRVVRPGDPAGSELLIRVASSGDDRMPPHGPRLSPAQVETLRRWVAGGAGWTAHWAYQPASNPVPPAVSRPDWVRNPIDQFVLARLDQDGVAPAAEADRPALLRRLAFALTGLPPTPDEVDAFAAVKTPDAYDRQVDRLLASPHYGERMAVFWLDLARYADTNGTNVDNGREMWPYRDWVVRAFNRNQPFDQFTVEQLAGDLLPNPTPEQRVATGFHRNAVLFREASPEERAAQTVIERVNATGLTWLGTTLACAQCHDHKYDPVTQTDFYRLFAFFNNLPPASGETLDERGNHPPTLALPTPAQQAAADGLVALLARTDEPAAVRATFTALIGAPAAPGVDAHLARGAAARDLAALRAAIPHTMVVAELARPAESFVLTRGNFTAKGERVTPGVPEFLPPLPGGRPDRLALARWLTRPDHPLTARVFVNRMWQMHFGTGLVRTGDDFGARGEWPSHPELLDWLAARFVESGWDVKALHRLILRSATFRQTSRAPADRYRVDPDNRLLARGPRVRLAAEFVRDNALSLAGLLDPRAGGPGVFPAQPPGMWEAIRHAGDTTAQVYTPTTGPGRHRRGLYVFWKRTLPHPSFTLFDAPTREVGTDRRPRTNTPLQALALMNDPTAQDCARGLASRMAGDRDPIGHGFRLCTARLPDNREREVVAEVYATELSRFRADPTAAVRFAGDLPAGADPVPAAAWTAVAHVLLSLDETITAE